MDVELQVELKHINIYMTQTTEILSELEASKSSSLKVHNGNSDNE